MKRHLATALCFAVVTAGASVAGDNAQGQKAGADCYASVAAFSSGLPALTGADKLSAQAKIGQLTDNFSGVVQAVDKAQGCYEKAIKAAGSDVQVADLRAGAKDVGRIFRLSYEQYQKELEPLTAAAMGEISPAAGGDGTAGVGDSAMEALTNSMFVDEQAKKSLERQTALEGGATPK